MITPRVTLLISLISFKKMQKLPTVDISYRWTVLELEIYQRML